MLMVCLNSVKRDLYEKYMCIQAKPIYTYIYTHTHTHTHTWSARTALRNIFFKKKKRYQRECSWSARTAEILFLPLNSLSSLVSFSFLSLLRETRLVLAYLPYNFTEQRTFENKLPGARAHGLIEGRPVAQMWDCLVEKKVKSDPQYIYYI